MNILSILLILSSYLIGAIPFGLALSRNSGIDIRKEGSKNIGATNVARLLGKKMGLLTLLCDIAKGFFPICAAALICKGENANLLIALCGAATVIGHMFPVYLGFKGGKGVATGLGIFLFLSPLAVVGSLLFFIAVVWYSGFVSLGSLLGSAITIPLLYLLGAPDWKTGLAFFVVFMIWFKHHENIGRLLRGEEKSWKQKEGRS
jgi:glycerol-3-phosphate acyltransferase PlsY